MDELSIDEILIGLRNQSFVSQRLNLLELLTNKLAEETTVENSTLKIVFDLVLTIPIITASTSDGGKKIISTSISALSNATTKEESAGLLLEHIEPADSKLQKQFHFIIKKYIQYNPQAESSEVEDPDWVLLDEWQHVGSVLCNICQTDKGRSAIMKTSNGYMDRIAMQVSNNFEQCLILNK
jgi:hypothetical protein